MNGLIAKALVQTRQHQVSTGMALLIGEYRQMLDALSQTVVPPKPALWRRWTALPVFSYYNRLAALVLLSNLAFAVLGVGLQGVSAQKRLVQSLVCGMGVGFICGFIGAGGGMMMLLILTSVLGYELKTAVGTSVFIMTFTALTGAVSHFMIGGAPNWFVWALCVVFTLLWARIAAVFANKADPKTLNRATGIVLVVLGVVIMGFNLLT